MHPAVARLVELMPPPDGGGMPVDWDAIAEQWGTRFPVDYREFIELYGGGSINESFHFSVPTKAGYKRTRATDLTTATEFGFALLNDDEDALSEAEGRICWAFDCGANHAYWDTISDDPDQWTVMVLERHGEWVHFRCGMAQFMVSFLAREIDQPMAMFDPQSPVFEPWPRA